MLKRRNALAISLAPRIVVLRGQKVILDADLAVLYGVPVKRLNQQVRRNLQRFPPDFMFQVPVTDRDSLRLQIATSNTGRGGRRYLPYAFTEHGAIMAATVLKSKRAIEMSVFVVRAFVRLREALASNRQVAVKIEELEERLGTHDAALQAIVQAIKELIAPPKKLHRKIGFRLPALKKTA
ncbi:MAG: ORF6N domain-containing protein [Terriglobales bacterium]|jgi:ORF6N domain-containing protein